MTNISLFVLETEEPVLSQERNRDTVMFNEDNSEQSE